MNDVQYKLNIKSKQGEKTRSFDTTATLDYWIQNYNLLSGKGCKYTICALVDNNIVYSSTSFNNLEENNEYESIVSEAEIAVEKVLQFNEIEKEGLSKDE